MTSQLPLLMSLMVWGHRKVLIAKICRDLQDGLPNKILQDLQKRTKGSSSKIHEQSALQLGIHKQNIANACKTKDSPATEMTHSGHESANKSLGREDSLAHRFFQNNPPSGGCFRLGQPTIGRPKGQQVGTNGQKPQFLGFNFHIFPNLPKRKFEVPLLGQYA